MECKDIDALIADIRGKVIRGAKSTRAGRLRSCLRVLDPQVSSEIGKSALDEHAEHKESSMNINEAVARFRQIGEANIPAPSVDRKTPGGSKQTSSKSKFDNHKEAGKTYAGKAASVPDDAESMKAAPYSGGVSGSGYNGTGREKVDVRFEDKHGLDHWPQNGDKADLEFAESMLGDQVGYFPSMEGYLAEQNLAAPGVSRKTPDGKSQISAKSRFRKGYKGANKKYDGSAASIRADKDAMDEEPGVTDGVDGAGYTADGREEIDVRGE